MAVITKENNGKAARKAYLKRLTTIGLVLAVIFFGLFLLGVFEQSGGRNVGKESAQAFFERHQHDHNRKAMEKAKSRAGGSLMGRLMGGSEGPQKIELKDLEDFESLRPLLDAKVHLVDIKADVNSMKAFNEDTYGGVTAEFCRIDFSLHKKDPSSVPMFRHLVEASEGCKRGPHYVVDLKEFTIMARKHDIMIQTQGKELVPKPLDLKGVVFHESRCGSTLVANALIAMNPKENRVFSESAPPITALKSICGDESQICSKSQAALMLADVMYLMSRTDDPDEKHVFFKIQSIGSRNIETFQLAFPKTPWIFVYRDPVQVMMSQLKMGTKNANCVRPKHGKQVSKLTTMVESKGLFVHLLSSEMYCAAHLATITESAVQAMQREPQGHLGTPVNYAQLPQVLYQDILPNKFGVPLTQEEIDNIVKISGQYSKGNAGRHGEFVEDSEKKEESATEEVRKASTVFLQESYAILERGGTK